MKRIFTLLFISVSIFTQAAIHVINVEDFEFNPSSLTINLGDTIQWVYDNSANYAHTTTSTNVPNNAVSWGAAIDQTHTSYMYVPAVAGVYEYQCDFHYAMGMTGQFIVNDPLSVNTIQSNKLIRLRSSRVNEYLTVEMPELQQEVVPIVRDLTGRVVQTFDAIAPGTTTLYVGTLKNGIYLLELSSYSFRISYRFIKY